MPHYFAVYIRLPRELFGTFPKTVQFAQLVHRAYFRVMPENANHTEIAIAALRSQLGDIINRVAYAHDRVLITRNGKPVAALISAADLAHFELLEIAERGY